MSKSPPELYATLTPECQKIVDNVSSAFITSLINVLKCNFKQNNESSNEYTSSQRLAITFANRWFTGLLTELIHQLSNTNRNVLLNRNFISNMNPLDLTESQIDRGNYTCSVPHTKVDDGQIKVNYSSEMSDQTSELTAQDFGHLLFTGLQHQMAIKNTLQQFWSVCGSLILKSVSKIMKSSRDDGLSTDYPLKDNGKFDDLVFSKNWYQAVEESFGIVPINSMEGIEGILGFEELQEMSKKLQNDLNDAIEQARILGRIKTLIDENNNL